jgi:ribosomal protein S1
MSDSTTAPGSSEASEQPIDQPTSEPTPVEITAATPEPEAADAPSETETVAVPEPEAAATPEPEPEPEPVAAAEPEPVAVAEPEPVAVAEPEPVAVAEPEPAAVAEPEPASTPKPPTPEITTPTIVGHISAEDFARMQEEERKRREEEKERKEAERRAREESYAMLAQFKESGTPFEITIQERVKGGLRGDFNGLRVFLPASHFGLRKNVPEEELAASVGDRVRVKVHELQSDENGYKSAVVSRRDLLQDDFWGGIEPGTVHEGVVTSITTFGAFVNIGGVEGLVHISRLSRSRVNTADEVVKKGDRIKVTVVEVDRAARKLSLSHREHEVDPWTGVDQLFPVGTVMKGIVRRITDFGAYVQVASKIEGLLRVSELSWTQRVKHPSDVITVGQEIEVAVLDVNPPKHLLALGYKQTQHNPWNDVEQTLPVGSNIKGVVQQVSQQGAVVRVNNQFDGFMPRSKMITSGPARKITLNMGDEIDCVVSDLNPAAASLILAMVNEDGTAFTGEQHGYQGGGGYEAPASYEQRGGGGGGGGRGGDRGGDRGDRGERGDRRRDGGRGKGKGERRERNDDDDYSSYEGGSDSSSPGVTLGDLLREVDKSKLNG